MPEFTPAVALDISKAFDSVWHAGFLHLSLMKFWVKYLGFFLFFSVIDGFEWFWMGSLYKNVQLMLSLSSFSRLHSWSYFFSTIHQ